MRTDALTAGICTALGIAVELSSALVDPLPTGSGYAMVPPYYAVPVFLPVVPMLPVEVGVPGGRFLNPFNLSLSDDIWTYAV